jgi:hypothetical protein
MNEILKHGFRNSERMNEVLKHGFMYTRDRKLSFPSLRWETPPPRFLRLTLRSPTLPPCFRHPQGEAIRPRALSGLLHPASYRIRSANGRQVTPRRELSAEVCRSYVKKMRCR